MDLKDLVGKLTGAASTAGHLFGMKEIADQIGDMFTVAGTVRSVAAPRGTEEERGFIILLEAIDKKANGKSNGLRAVLVKYLAHVFTPPAHTGMIGKIEYNRAKQDFMKFVLNMKDDPLHRTTPETWLTDLANRLKVGGEESYDQIAAEHRLFGVPYPPELHFDERVDLVYRNAMAERNKAGWLHKLVRDYL